MRAFHVEESSSGSKRQKRSQTDRQMPGEKESKEESRSPSQRAEPRGVWATRRTQKKEEGERREARCTIPKEPKYIYVENLEYLRKLEREGKIAKLQATLQRYAGAQQVACSREYKVIRDRFGLVGEALRIMDQGKKTIQQAFYRARVWHSQMHPDEEVEEWEVYTFPVLGPGAWEDHFSYIETNRRKDGGPM